jgi:hypothetical protein
MCFLLAAGVVYLLTLAMRTIPVGTAYAVFTGIGAVCVGRQRLRRVRIVPAVNVFRREGEDSCSTLLRARVDR